MQEYGNLTLEEEKSLYNDLEEEKFDLKKISVNIPNGLNTYGELVAFTIEYKAHININFFNIGTPKTQNINLKVIKSFYIKK